MPQKSTDSVLQDSHGRCFHQNKFSLDTILQGLHLWLSVAQEKCDWLKKHKPATRRMIGVSRLFSSIDPACGDRSGYAGLGIFVIEESKIYVWEGYKSWLHGLLVSKYVPWEELMFNFLLHCCRGNVAWFQTASLHTCLMCSGIETNEVKQNGNSVWLSG